MGIRPFKLSTHLFFLIAKRRGEETKSIKRGSWPWWILDCPPASVSPREGAQGQGRPQTRSVMECGGTPRGANGKHSARRPMAIECGSWLPAGVGLRVRRGGRRDGDRRHDATPPPDSTWSTIRAKQSRMSGGPPPASLPSPVARFGSAPAAGIDGPRGHAPPRAPPHPGSTATDAAARRHPDADTTPPARPRAR